MKCNTAILFVALTLAIPGAVNAAATVAVLDQLAKQKEREDQLEAVERDALAQPDAWKAYLQVSEQCLLMLPSCCKTATAASPFHWH
ncbi:hypothetical protein [Cronobacter sakazakii]|uniref:hypothetical protein n=1 Tax=Cronobacter sakazakii TaxID=28141 RepID=UPI0009BA6613|nr:hypothetical protein [Cronobacter sakazakii]PUY13607.1 hypothetical protein BTK72_18250 [Cronobacter sakazakii]